MVNYIYIHALLLWNQTCVPFCCPESGPKGKDVTTSSTLSASIDLYVYNSLKSLHIIILAVEHRKTLSGLTHTYVHILLQVGNLDNVYHFMLADSALHDASKESTYSLSVVGDKSEKTAALLQEEHVRHIYI